MEVDKLVVSVGFQVDKASAKAALDEIKKIKDAQSGLARGGVKTGATQAPAPNPLKQSIAAQRFMAAQANADTALSRAAYTASLAGHRLQEAQDLSAHRVAAAGFRTSVAEQAALAAAAKTNATAELMGIRTGAARDIAANNVAASGQRLERARAATESAAALAGIRVSTASSISARRVGVADARLAAAQASASAAAELAGIRTNTARDLAANRVAAAASRLAASEELAGIRKQTAYRLSGIRTDAAQRIADNRIDASASRAAAALANADAAASRAAAAASISGSRSTAAASNATTTTAINAAKLAAAQAASQSNASAAASRAQAAASRAQAAASGVQAAANRATTSAINVQTSLSRLSTQQANQASAQNRQAISAINLQAAQARAAARARREASFLHSPEGQFVVGGAAAFPMAMYGVGRAAYAGLHASSDVQRMQDRLSMVSAMSGSGASRFEEVANLASQVRSTGIDLGSLVARIGMSAPEVSQKQIFSIARTLNRGLALGGAGGAERRSATTQLTQAIASGTLGGDELRSLKENAPVVMEALSRALGLTVGELKQAGKQGELTRDVLIGAFEMIEKEIADKSKNMRMNFDDAAAGMENSAQRIANAVIAKTNIIDRLSQSVLGFTSAAEARVMGIIDAMSSNQIIGTGAGVLAGVAAGATAGGVGGMILGSGVASVPLGAIGAVAGGIAGGFVGGQVGVTGGTIADRIDAYRAANNTVTINMTNNFNQPTDPQSVSSSIAGSLSDAFSGGQLMQGYGL